MYNTLNEFLINSLATQCPDCLMWEVRDIDGDIVANDIRACSEFEAKEIAWVALIFVESMIEHEAYLAKNN